MADRKWLPTEYQDEVIPPPRPTVGAWLTRATDGGWLLAPIEDPGFARPLSNGDVVEFDWTESHGTAEFTVNADRSWSIDTPLPEPPPGGYMLVMEIGNHESMDTSVERFAENWINTDPYPCTTTVVFYSWSERPTAFVFRDGGLHPQDAELPATAH